MLSRLAAAIAIVILVAGCGSSAVPSSSAVAIATTAPSATAMPTSTPSPVPTSTPSASPSSATFDPDAPFAGQAYTMDVPEGWEALDFTASTSASLEAFTQANPGFAGAIENFKSIPSLRLLVNQLLGQAIVTFSLPSQGLSQDAIGQSLTAQFQNVPGLSSKPTAKSVTIPVGPALRWAIDLSANKPGGGTSKVHESVYLISDPKTAVIVEFVTPQGGTEPDEATILKTLRFQP